MIEIPELITNIRKMDLHITMSIVQLNKLIVMEKNAFDWGLSLRFKEDWLKFIIYIPCLCHRIDNAYKYHATHSPELQAITSNIKNYSKVLSDHKNDIGSKCPSPITTRWLYDFDILEFIIKHKDSTQKFVELNDQDLFLYDILFIFKSLIRIFENPNTHFWRAFYYIERAAKAFEELKEKGNPFAEGFLSSLMKYTLESEEGGIWVLTYLLTVSGHNDFRTRIGNGSLTYSGEGLSFRNREERTRMILSSKVSPKLLTNQLKI